jgi:hypothetical protein
MSSYPVINPRYDVGASSNVAGFARNLWLAATANHEARNDPDSHTVIPVRSDYEARELAAVVVDYAAKTFRLHVQRDGDCLVWPNGAVLAFSVSGRTPIRSAQPPIAANEAPAIEGVNISRAPKLHLHAENLFWKSGFGDGDILFDWIWDFADAKGIEPPTAWLDNDHEVLRRLVREHLLPLIPGEFTVYDIETIHNPIRISTWRGVEWKDYRAHAPDEVADIEAIVDAAAVVVAFERGSHPAITVADEIRGIQ